MTDCIKQDFFSLMKDLVALVSQLSSRAAPRHAAQRTQPVGSDGRRSAQQTGSQAALEFTRTQWNPWGAPRHSHAYTLRCVAYSMFHIGYLVEEKRVVPQGERHRVEAPFHLAEECPGCLHLEAVNLVGVSFVDGGPLTSILGLSSQNDNRTL